MVREAESHAEEDKRKREEIEARNKADSMIYQVEKALKENREKVPDNDARAVEAAIAETKKALDSGDVARIEKAVDALNQASHKVFEAMYKGAGPQPGGPQPDGGGEAPDGKAGGKSDGDVIDAEYVDVDDKKKD
jgi:molecular chaperone DnaK